MQRPSLAIVAGGAGPLHALRVGHGVPLEGELAGGAAGELVEVQGRLPLHAPLLLQASLLLLSELVVEGEAHVQRVVLRLREPQGGLALEADGPERGLALLVGRQLCQLRLPGEPVPQELRWIR